MKQNKSNIFNKLRNTQEIEQSVEDSHGLPQLLSQCDSSSENNSKSQETGVNSSEDIKFELTCLQYLTVSNWISLELLSKQYISRNSGQNFKALFYYGVAMYK